MYVVTSVTSEYYVFHQRSLSYICESSKAYSPCSIILFDDYNKNKVDYIKEIRTLDMCIFDWDIACVVGNFKWQKATLY